MVVICRNLNHSGRSYRECYVVTGNGRVNIHVRAVKSTMKKVPAKIWGRYNSLLAPGRTRYQPVIPANLPNQGEIDGSFDFVLPDEILECLRGWVHQRGESRIYYFLTECIQGENTDFELGPSELTSEVLLGLNKGSENVIVGQDFSWAVFVDHEGVMHVAGPIELFMLLRDCNGSS